MQLKNATITSSESHNRQILSDVVLEDCTFDGLAGLTPDWENPDPSLRPTVRNVSLKNTKAYAGYLEGAIIEDIVLDTTKAGKAPVFLRGNVYKHVKLVGQLAPIEIRGKVFPPIGFDRKEQERIMSAWDIANKKYYQSVDWALDITEASFGSFSVSGVPSHLIRRNPEDTAVVTRESALRAKLNEIPFKRGLFKVSIEWLLEDGYDDQLLVACRRSKRYQDDLYDLQLLRDAGIADVN